MNALPDLQDDDVRETQARALAIVRVLAACEAELLRLECTPHFDGEDTAGLTMARGFVARALSALGRFA